MKKQLEPLNVLVGKWKTTGRTLDESSEELSATDTYEWLDGGGFLVHRVAGSLGSKPLSSIEIIGLDGSHDDFIMHSYDSSGSAVIMHGKLDGENWTIEGKDHRFAGVIRGDRITGTWHMRDEAGRWSPWMEIVLTREAG